MLRARRDAHWGWGLGPWLSRGSLIKIPWRAAAHQVAGPCLPGFLLQWTWGGASEFVFAFLRVLLLLLLDSGPQTQDHWANRRGWHCQNPVSPERALRARLPVSEKGTLPAARGVMSESRRKDLLREEWTSMDVRWAEGWSQWQELEAERKGPVPTPSSSLPGSLWLPLSAEPNENSRPSTEFAECPTQHPRAELTG